MKKTWVGEGSPPWKMLENECQDEINQHILFAGLIDTSTHTVDPTDPVES